VNERVADIASAFGSRWIQGYVRGKLKHDPVYAAAAALLKDARGPILDIGCGLGILAHYLAGEGITQPVVGYDFDSRKVFAARRAAVARGLNSRLFVGDARSPLRLSGSVAMLDVLHYFSDGDQRKILLNAAASVGSGGVLLLRDCLADDSWRYRVTQIQERFSRVIGWLRGDRLNYPTREFIVEILASAGLECTEVRPLWQGTPFNNYLLVFRRT
jgi:SAM-dependent methyltransferase